MLLNVTISFPVCISGVGVTVMCACLVC